jgi:hypothetical protein
MPTAKDTPQTYPNYTNLGLEEGVFDRLMLASKAHVQQEFEAGRINAAAYGNVFLGITEAAMQSATQYLLGMLLIDEKRRGQDLANQKLEYELEVLLPAQYDKLLVETDLLKAQINKISKELEKMTAEISLMGKQEDKLDKEIEFLSAKIMTERANTEAGIAEAGSLIGKQLSLLTAQRMGFAGDIRAKLAKLEADYAAVYQSVQEVEAETSLGPAATDLMGPAGTIADNIMSLS